VDFVSLIMVFNCFSVLSCSHRNHSALSSCNVLCNAVTVVCPVAVLLSGALGFHTVATDVQSLSNCDQSLVEGTLLVSHSTT
jgi:hypothetical protein